MSEPLATRRQEREQVHDEAMWERVTSGQRLTEQIRCPSVVLRETREAGDEFLVGNDAAKRGEFHGAHRLARLLVWKGLGARRRKLGAMPPSRMRTEERA